MRNKLNCVLLVDDDEPTNFLHSIILDESEVSNKVLAFQWGQEALNYLAQKNGYALKNTEYPIPDLILLDINMPKMNGWEFVDEYKKLSPDLLSRVKLIMLTTSTNPDDEIRARSIAQIHDFQSKPLTTEGLEEMVCKHFPGLV